MSIILFVDRVLTKISLEWRKAVFKKKAEICGGVVYNIWENIPQQS